jgi:predicted nucleic acid-binding protein
VRWLLDTNVLIDAFAGRADSVRAITSARTANLEWIGCSAITRLELLGFPGLSAADEQGLRIYWRNLAKRQSITLSSSEQSKFANPFGSKYRMLS